MTTRTLTNLMLAGVLTALASMPCSTSTLAQAQQPDPASVTPAVQAPFAVSYSTRFTVRADKTATQISTVRYKILAPGAIQPLSQQRLQYVEGMQRLETIEAYTEKADGRKVPVQTASIITRDATDGSGATYTRDQKERIIIFPDVEVGDTLVMTNKEETLKGMFPGQFYYADVFPRSFPITSARIVVEAPRTLDLQVKTLGAGLTSQMEESGVIRRHIVTLGPRPSVPEEPGAVSALDREPLLLISTFKSYQEIGLAYRAAALPKSMVTPEIASLANEITKGIEDKRAQAIAIDAWMKKNIRYVAVYLSVGRVVPNDAAAVLRNKFGDCKDKATLMSALLAAKGIESEAVLINMGNAYTLPEPPTMAGLNHAILYLPQFDLYADPTVTQSAFGVLAAEAYDKPVVRVSAAGATLARTPTMRAQDHAYLVRTTINVAADGAVSGRTEESGTGVFGVFLRSTAGRVQNFGSETAAQRQLQNSNTPGTGRYELGNSAETTDPVIIRNTFNLQERLKLPSSGTAYIPNGIPLLVRPGGFLVGNRLSGRKSPFPCFAGRQVEDMEVTFAPGLPMPTPIVSRTINNAAFTYHSRFAVEGRTLKMHREFTSHVGAQTCPAELEAQIAEDMKLVARNMNNTFAFGAVASAAPPKPQATEAPRPAPAAAPGQVPAPAPAPASAPKQPQMQEAARVIPSDQKRRIDFIYWLEPDCTTPELPVLRIVEQPRNGKVTVERSTGFTNFPQSNPRDECNRRKSDGVSLVFEPAPRFVGIESITVEILLPSGHAVKRHYTIEVKAVESVSSVPNPTSAN